MVEPQISQLRAAVGPDADRYEARFNRIAASGRRWVPGWNWAAFLHSTAWFCYRRMYGFAFLNFLAPWILLFALVVAGRWIPPSALGTAGLVLFTTYVACVFILVPLFANSVYYHHLLARLPEARPPSFWTSSGAVILALAYGTLPIVFMPSPYVDYTPRAKVSEAILASNSMRAAVTDFYQQHRRLPNTVEAARFAGEPSRYVRSMVYDAENRVIVVTMSDPFPGKRFALRPIEERGELAGWKCGPIDLERKNMPGSCRQ
jgi:hypothetical protein